MRNGMILAVPNPSPMSGGAGIDAAIQVALEEAGKRGLKGRDVTPFVLASVSEATGGQSLKSNVALVRRGWVEQGFERTVVERWVLCEGSISIRRFGLWPQEGRACSKKIDRDTCLSGYGLFWLGRMVDLKKICFFGIVCTKEATLSIDFLNQYRTQP